MDGFLSLHPLPDGDSQFDTDHPASKGTGVPTMTGEWASELAAWNVANENGRRGYDMLPLWVGGRVPYLRPRYSMAYVWWVYEKALAAARHTMFKRACTKTAGNDGILRGAVTTAGRTGVGSTRYPALTPRSTERLSR